MTNTAGATGVETSGRGLDVLVVGAGIGGLGSALALARNGHRVTIVERDDTPMPADVEGAFEWDRRGAPQVRHPHAFLGLAYTILRDRFPDVLAALTDHGVHTITMGTSSPIPMPPDVLTALADDVDLRMLACRRTTFEWVLRGVVAAETNVTLRVGSGVAALLADRPSGDGDDRRPTVRGVRLEDGSEVAADVVVATTGRRGDVPAWLRALDVEVAETTVDSGVVYFSRFYRAPGSQDFGFRGGFGAGLLAGVIGADADTFSITAVVDKGDRELRAHLSDDRRFDATMALMPELADVAAASGDPIHPVHCMTGLLNRTRRYTDGGGVPLVRGFVAVGDAHTCTNPAYGRGQSLALLQATLLADAITVESDLDAAIAAYEAASVAEVEPWYHFSVMTDQMRGMRPDSLPEERDSAGGGLFDITLLAAGGAGADLVRHLMRVMNLLEKPATLIDRMGEFQTASAAGFRARRDGTAPTVPKVRHPSRTDLLTVGI